MNGLMSAGSGTEIYKIATNLNFYGSTTINVASKVPFYRSLTNDDFIVCLNGGRSDNYGETGGRQIWAEYRPITKSYNSGTGVLTLRGYGASIMYSGGYYIRGTAIVDVYIIQKTKDVSSL